ncbi:hypothetical protein [Ensifer soli]|uniref:hypothetical protein n=1 Tax=Ciceribacter sp. sgz301302 TaxID=3342379 RepID=UPI0035BA0272
MQHVSDGNHRSDLTEQERADHREEWIRLRAGKIGQLDQFSKVGAGRGNEGGLSLAVREMPKLDGKSDEAKRSELRRSLTIAVKPVRSEVLERVASGEKVTAKETEAFP